VEVYAPDGSLYDTFYLSFNTPVGSKDACRPRRLLDIHVIGSYASQTQAVAGRRARHRIQSDHTKNEIALEFLFLRSGHVHPGRHAPAAPTLRQVAVPFRGTQNTGREA